MTKRETLPATKTNSGYAMVALTFSFAISGCVQASHWLSENKLKDSHGVVEFSEDDLDSGSPQFDTTKTENEAKRAKLFLTNFKQPASPTERTPAGEAAPETPALKSHKTTTVEMPMPHKSDTVWLQKSLITLAEKESLDAKLKQAPGVVIVDFYADWCGPCRRQANILHSMQSKASENNATIIKVNIEQHRQLAKKYKVSSLPTLVVIKQGTEVSRQVGLANQTKVASLMKL